MSLNGKKILVAGGASFIGSHLVEALLARGTASVRVVDSRFYEAERVPGLQKGFVVETESYWTNDDTNLLVECDKDQALCFEASSSSLNPRDNSYALECFVLETEKGGREC